MTTLTVKARPATLTVQGAAAYAPTFDWYVDSVNGLDSNSGVTHWLPFKTLAKLQTVWGAGDTVHLESGSEWREELLPAVNNISITGSGTPPIIRCDDVAPNASFTKTVGQTNVYQITVSPDLAATGTFNSVWENDVRLVRATSVANCDATAGSYFPSSETVAPITLYVHASDSSSVITNGKVYEYAKRRTSIDCFNVTGTTLNGIVGMRNLGESGSLRMGVSSTVLNCQGNDGNKHNVYVRTGSYCYNVSCSKAYYDPSAPSKSFFVYNDNIPASEGITFINCTVDNGGVLDENAEGFYGHYNASGTYGAVLMQGCTVRDCGVGYDGIHAATLSVIDCFTYACKAFASVNQNMTIHGGGFYTGASCDNVLGFGGAYILDISDFTFGDDYTAVNANIYCAKAATINMDTVTFLREAALGPIHIWVSVAGATITATGCDFSQGTYVYYLPEAVTLTSDYNRFRHATECNFNIAGTDYATVALYKTGTGQDTNSTIG